jgi:hypothetical protein
MAIEPTAMTALQGPRRASQADTRPRASMTRATCHTANAMMQTVGGLMLDASPGRPTMLDGYRPVPVRITRAPRPAAPRPPSARRDSLARVPSA